MVEFRIHVLGGELCIYCIITVSKINYAGVTTYPRTNFTASSLPRGKLPCLEYSVFPMEINVGTLATVGGVDLSVESTFDLSGLLRPLANSPEVATNREGKR